MQEKQAGAKASAARPLSEIMIEIATLGLKPPFCDQLPVPGSAHILLLLATEAWNRQVLAGRPNPSFGNGIKVAEEMRKELGITQADLEQQLISTDWETIVGIMQRYKQTHFPDDRREIGACGYTPHGTVRVLWK